MGTTYTMGTTITFIMGTTYTMGTTIHPMLVWPVHPSPEGHPQVQYREDSLPLEALTVLYQLHQLLLYHRVAHLHL